MARVPATDDARRTRSVARPVVGRGLRRRDVRPRVALAALVAVVAPFSIGGCGSASVHDLPPAAEPAASPAPTTPAEGEVWQVRGHPEGVVIDAASQIAAVALRRPDRLRLIDLRTRTTIKDVALPGEARHLALQSSASGGDDPTSEASATGATDVRVLVPVESAGRLLSVALPSGRIVGDVKVGDHPHDVTALSPESAVVGNERGNSITLVKGDRAVRTVRVATQPGGVTSLRQGSLVAVVSVRERKLEIFDGATLRRRSVQPAGVGPTHVVCAPQGPCFVADTQGDALLVFRVGAGGTTLRLTRRVYLGTLGASPYGIAIDPTHSRTRLWVTLTGRNELVELAAQGRPHVLSRTPTVRQPNSVAVDQGTGDVVVAGATDAGDLQLLANPASPNR